MLRLSLSALVVLVAEPLYLLLDLAVVGRLGAVDLAALAVGALVLSVVSTQLTFLSYGTTSRAARLFGAGDRPGAVNEGVQASWVAIVVGMVIVAVVGPLAPQVLSLVAADGDVAADAVTWLRVAVWGVPLILLSMAGNGWLRGVQDPRRPVIYVVVGLGISAVLCPTLVHGLVGMPALGLVGSAIANLVGQSVSGVLFVAWVLRSTSQPLAPQWSVIREQLKLGRDLILRSLGFQICFVSAAAVAARFGVAALAAHQLVLQLWNFVSLFLDSVAIAAQALVGAALGARDTARARWWLRRATGWSLAMTAVMVVLFAAGSQLVPRIFTSDESVLAATSTPWWFLVGMLPIAGVVFALDGVLLGAGDARYLRTTTLAGALLAFLPMIWLSLVVHWGLAGIWGGLMAFMVARLIAVVVRVRGRAWQQAPVPN